MYDPMMVQPMREEAVDIGFKELYTSEEVENELKKDGTSFVFVNSVCGCAAGKARPGLRIAINWAKENNFMPDRLITVFAGMEKDAVNQVRSYLDNNPPTSPQMALLKDGKLVELIQRNEIENNDAYKVAEKVANVLSKHCAKESEKSL
jgi:putative YphP/YqiW family bacilliredoxin